MDGAVTGQLAVIPVEVVIISVINLLGGGGW